MAFNLKEYILFREEIKRELFNVEVDENFKAVSNPWVDYRRYEIGQIVYHPVTIESTTGETTPTGGPEEYLTWWRANTRTTYGVFDMTQWDIIGGIGGFTNITIAGSKSFGKILANWTPPIALPWSAAPNGLLEATSPTDTFKFVAGTGMSIEWNAVEEAMQFTNTGALGEINHGDNVGIGGEDVYVGMSGGVPNNLEFKGFDATNVGAAALTISTDGSNNIVYDFDEGQVDLAALNAGSPLIEMLSDVNAGAVAGQILQYNGAAWQPVAVAVIGANNIYDTSATIAAATRTVTLNAGAGHLKFANGADGLGINNNGLSYVIGENVTTFPAHLIDFNANDILDFQIRLTNSDANGNASINLEPGDGRDYTMGVHNVLVGDSYWSLNRGSSQTSLANDDLSIDLNGALWVNNWGIPSYTPPVPKQAAHYVPFAAPSGLIQGKTYTELDLVWTYDGTDGTNSNAKQFFINIDSLGGIPDVGSSSKLGLFVTNIPNEDFTEDNVGIYVYARNHTNDPTGVAQRVQGILSTISDQSGPDTLVNSRVGFWDDGTEGLTGLYGFHSNLKHMLPDADISVGFAGITQGEQIRQIGLGAILHDDAVLTNYFGVYTDVINTTAEPENGFSEITDTGIWAGFFRGCVNITEGGLRLDPQVGPPSCNGNPDETLWINSVDGHVYRGNVDLEDIGGMITLCDLSDVDCPTGGPADGDIIEYDAGLGLWVSVANPGGGANIYNADGIQTDAVRTFTGSAGMPGSQTRFEGIGTLLTSADRSTHYSLVSQYSIDAASYFGVTAGSYIQMDAATNFNVATMDGQVWLDANGLAAQVLIDSDGPISETAATTVTVGAGTAIDITAGTTYDVTSTGNATITTTALSGANIYLTSDNDIVLGCNNDISLTTGVSAGSVTADAFENIILTANAPGSQNIISLVVGSDATDFISIETQRWSSLGPLGTATDGPALMALDIAGNDVTEYADWTLPKAAGADTNILQYSAALGGVEWVAAGGGGGCCDLQDTMNVGSVAVGLSTDVQIVTSGEIRIESTNDEIEIEALDALKLSACNIVLSAGDCGSTGEVGQITLHAEGNIEIISSEGNIRLDADGLLEVGDSTGSGYTFPTSTGGLGQILALIGPNTLDWVDDSVFTLCDAPVDCPTGGPVDGDTLLFSSSSGAWEVAAGGCCNLQDTMDAGSIATIVPDITIETAGLMNLWGDSIVLGDPGIGSTILFNVDAVSLNVGSTGNTTNTWVQANNNLRLEASYVEIKDMGSGIDITAQALLNLISTGIGMGVNVEATDGEVIIESAMTVPGPSSAKITLGQDIQFIGTGLGTPNIGDALVAKDITGNLEWGSPSICGEPIDCPTGGPADGDGLFYSTGTGMWEITTDPSCCTLQEAIDKSLATTAYPGFAIGNAGTDSLILISTDQPLSYVGDDVNLAGLYIMGDPPGDSEYNVMLRSWIEGSSGEGVGLLSLHQKENTGDSTGIGPQKEALLILHGGEIIVGSTGAGTPSIGDVLVAKAEETLEPGDIPVWSLEWTTPSAGGDGIYGGSGIVPTSTTATLTDTLNFQGGAGLSTLMYTQAVGNDCTTEAFLIADGSSNQQFLMMGDGRIGIGNDFIDNAHIGTFSGSFANSSSISLNINDTVSAFTTANTCAPANNLQDGALIINKTYEAIDAGVGGSAEPKTAIWAGVNSNNALSDSLNPYIGAVVWAGHSGAGDLLINGANSPCLTGIKTYVYTNTAADTEWMIGIDNQVGIQGSAGHTEYAYGINAQGITVGGSASAGYLYNIMLGPHIVSGTLDHARYGIYQGVTANNDINVFCADVNIGDGASLKIHNAGDPPGQGGTPSNFNEFKTNSAQVVDLIYQFPMDAGAPGDVLTSDGQGVAPLVNTLSWTTPGTSWDLTNIGQASFRLDDGITLPSAVDSYMIGGAGGWNDSAFTRIANLTPGATGTLALTSFNCGFPSPVTGGGGTDFTQIKICGMYMVPTSGLDGTNILEVVVKKIRCDVNHVNIGQLYWTVEDIGDWTFSDWTTDPVGEPSISYICFSETAEISASIACGDFFIVGFRDTAGNFSTATDRGSYRLDYIS